MGFFTKDREPETFQEAVALLQSPPRKYKNDPSYHLKRGRQVFDFGCGMAREGRLAGTEASIWMRCGTMVITMYRNGVGTPVNPEESAKCLDILINTGGGLAQENKISIEDYVILVQCWEQQADDMMTGFGRPVDYLMARTTYNMVLANVQLFEKAEEYRNRIQEKFDQATQKYLDSTVDY